MTPQIKAKTLVEKGMTATAREDLTGDNIYDIRDAVQYAVDFATAMTDPAKNNNIKRADVVYWNYVKDEAHKYLPTP